MFFRMKTKFLAQFLLIGLFGFGAQSAVFASENKTSESREIFVHQVEVDRVLATPVSNLSSLDQEDYFVSNSMSNVGTKINRIDAARKKIESIKEQRSSLASNNRSSDLSEFQSDLNCFSEKVLSAFRTSFVFVGTPTSDRNPGNSNATSSGRPFFFENNIASLSPAEGVVPTFEKNCPLVSFQDSLEFYPNAKIVSGSADFPWGFSVLAILNGLSENSSEQMSGSLDENSKESTVDLSYFSKISLRSELRLENGQNSSRFDVVGASGFQREEGTFSILVDESPRETEKIKEKISSIFRSHSNISSFLKMNPRKFDLPFSNSCLTPKSFSFKASTNENLRKPKSTAVDKRFLA
ncbi:hypothetical protein EHQ76_14270 [Leptospira barantonii]|uniref:Uncharacterized protein n=1 Tax=Leptospira barantonii TaxID=2023184 RepID=A0A5F2B0B6_9LEPT|nr:hypothetical protein [Leptospira barantonii]TGL97845.1 hypothetical protein EHQ76_14270 [Leptospira barantonii]